MAKTDRKLDKAPKAPKGNGPTTSSMVDEDKMWKAEDALRTLQRAEEVRNDHGLMKDVERCRQDKMRQLASIKVEVSPRTIKMPK
jgi:hypothetical protein